MLGRQKYNLTSHAYDKAKADLVYKIPENFIKDAKVSV
jgi:hypothetical protein